MIPGSVATTLAVCAVVPVWSKIILPSNAAVTLEVPTTLPILINFTSWSLISQPTTLEPSSKM